MDIVKLQKPEDETLDIFKVQDAKNAAKYSVPPKYWQSNREVIKEFEAFAESQQKLKPLRQKIEVAYIRCEVVEDPDENFLQFCYNSVRQLFKKSSVSSNQKSSVSSNQYDSAIWAIRPIPSKEDKTLRSDVTNGILAANKTNETSTSDEVNKVSAEEIQTYLEALSDFICQHNMYNTTTEINLCGFDEKVVNKINLHNIEKKSSSVFKRKAVSPLRIRRRMVPPLIVNKPSAHPRDLNDYKLNSQSKVSDKFVTTETVLGYKPQNKINNMQKLDTKLSFDNIFNKKLNISKTANNTFNKKTNASRTINKLYIQDDKKKQLNAPLLLWE